MCNWMQTTEQNPQFATKKFSGITHGKKIGRAWITGNCFSKRSQCSVTGRGWEWAFCLTVEESLHSYRTFVSSLDEVVLGDGCGVSDEIFIPPPARSMIACMFEPFYGFGFAWFETVWNIKNCPLKRNASEIGKGCGKTRSGAAVILGAGR